MVPICKVTIVAELFACADAASGRYDAKIASLAKRNLVEALRKASN